DPESRGNMDVRGVYWGGVGAGRGRVRRPGRSHEKTLSNCSQFPHVTLVPALRAGMPEIDRSAVTSRKPETLVFPCRNSLCYFP
ncbi:MAG TPA: hypothetical protein PLQ76_05160, partial [bacterium]|nr:hypothetical protein [bacterium]